LAFNSTPKVPFDREGLLDGFDRFPRALESQLFVPFANAFGDAERQMLSAGSSD
jgi:hypothetical protein